MEVSVKRESTVCTISGLELQTKPKTLHEEKKQNQACCRRCRGGADHLILTVLDYRPYHGDDSQGQSRSSVNFAGTCLWYVALIAQFKRLSSFA